jgi:hypothetical protein
MSVLTDVPAMLAPTHRPLDELLHPLPVVMALGFHVRRPAPAGTSGSTSRSAARRQEADLPVGRCEAAMADLKMRILSAATVHTCNYYRGSVLCSRPFHALPDS